MTDQAWELFIDESYYDMYCVRNTDDRRFNSPQSFHFIFEKDAVEFKRLLEIAE